MSTREELVKAVEEAVAAWYAGIPATDAGYVYIAATDAWVAYLAPWKVLKAYDKENAK